MTQPDDRTRPTSPADKLQYAITLAKAGRKTEARNVLRRVVALQPVNQAAWLWLSAVAADQAEAEAALAQARTINPAHPSLSRAEQWLVNRFSAQPLTQESPVIITPPSPPPPPAPVEAKNLFRLFNSTAFVLVILAIVLGLLVLLLGLALEANATTQPGQPPFSTPQGSTPGSFELSAFFKEQPSELDLAWTRRDWTRVITLLEELRRVKPTDPTVNDQLSHAYLQKGIALRHKGFIKEALVYFDQTLTLTPGQLRAQQESRFATSYLKGTENYQAGHWSEAIAALEAVRTENEDYVNVTDLLYSAYYNHGLALGAADELAPAQEAFEAAIGLRPDLPEPRLQIAEIDFALAPQTPPAQPIPVVSAADKTIVVGVAEQRMLVYEGDKKVFDFVVSTGEPGRDTAIGDFEILDKIDVAYASTWNLDMPYWMGIYWSGPLENGIHALPIVKHTGYKLWDGYLGQRVSYGCVILSDEDAATLYDWAEIGAQVKIVLSLDDWRPEDKAKN